MMINDKLRHWKRTVKIRWGDLIAIIVSLASFFVALNSNYIYRLQAEIAKNSELPSFQLKSDVEYDDSYNTNNTIIQISALNGKPINYESKIITFLRCSIFTDLGISYINVRVPLYYYYLDSLYFNERNNNIIDLFDCKYRFNIVKDLKNDINAFNEQEQGKTIYAFLESYIKITYLNLIGETETEYYMIDSIKREPVRIDNNSGKTIFEEYQQCRLNGYGLDLSEPENINLQILQENIKTIYSSSLLLRRDGMDQIILGFIGGIILSLTINTLLSSRKTTLQRRHFAALLYYDLKSVESYLKENRITNLPYNNSWKNILIECNFLLSEDIKILYDLYNTIYTLHNAYKQKVKGAKSAKRHDVPSYDELRSKIFFVTDTYIDDTRYNVTYEKIMNKLEKNIGSVKSDAQK